MLNHPKISVIVPVYNTERYIEECILSILAQTYDNFELILVNDGSTDSSLHICRNFAAKDHRIRIVNKLNQGVSAARKEGVAIAKGDFITFVDSDDILPEYSLESLTKQINPQKDIIIGSLDNNITQARIFSAKEYRTYCILGKIFPGPVAKLFKKELFDDFTFNIPRSIVKGEDMIMNVRIAFNCKAYIQLIPDNVYIYRKHSESCTFQFQSDWDYEGMFYEYLFSSVPKNNYEEYIKILMQKALEVWNDFWGYRYILPRNYKSTRLIQLLNENICKYPNNVNIFTKLEVKTINPIFRFFLVNIKRLIWKFKRK